MAAAHFVQVIADVDPEDFLNHDDERQLEEWRELVNRARGLMGEPPLHD